MFFFFFEDTPEDREARAVIAAALRRTADDVCRAEVIAGTQEPFITSRIGHALEREMDGFEYRGYRLQVLTKDVDALGPGALEREVGADLYVGVRVLRRNQVVWSKGMLAQAKKGLTVRNPGDLDDQCRKMLERTHAAYVWAYTDNGVRVVKAQAVLGRTSQKLARGRKLDRPLEATLACSEGDPKIGVPAGRLNKAALAGMVERMRYPTAIIIDVNAPDGAPKDVA